jgi:hypothetical protein
MSLVNIFLLLYERSVCVAAFSTGFSQLEKDFCAANCVRHRVVRERKEAPDANKAGARQRSLCFAATKRVRSTSSFALKADC